MIQALESESTRITRACSCADWIRLMLKMEIDSPPHDVEQRLPPRDRIVRVNAATRFSLFVSGFHFFFHAFLFGKCWTRVKVSSFYLPLFLFFIFWWTEEVQFLGCVSWLRKCFGIWHFGLRVIDFGVWAKQIINLVEYLGDMCRIDFCYRIVFWRRLRNGILRIMLEIDCEFGKIIQYENGKVPPELILK